MVEKFEVHIHAERFIHNDLSNCAFAMNEIVERKIAANERDGIYFEMMSSLMFSAFALEAKINFVGWKVLESGWPERSNLREKINLLLKVLSLELSWGERPLQTITGLKRFRDTIAHGKPEIVTGTTITEIEPVVWDALKGQWEEAVTAENVKLSMEDVDILWTIFLKAANISEFETLTHGGHSLTRITE